MNESRVPIEALLARGAWLQSLALELVGEPNRAEDLVQETWVRAIASPPREGVPVRAWLATVLRNLVRQEWRASESRIARELGRGPADPEAAVDDVVARAQAQRHLVEAVLGLDEKYGSVLLMRYFDGLDAGEIAERLGVPRSTVRTRLKRGLESLRESIDEQYGDDARHWLCALALAVPRASLAQTAKSSAVAAPAWLVAAIVVALPVALLSWIVFGDRAAPRGDVVAERVAPASVAGEPASVVAIAGDVDRRTGVTTRTDVDAAAAAPGDAPAEPEGEQGHAAAPADPPPFVVRVRIDGEPATRGRVALGRAGWLPPDLAGVDDDARAMLDVDGTARFARRADVPTTIGVQLPSGGVLQKGIHGPVDEPVLELGTASIEGVVRRPDGRPAADVEVMLGMQKGWDYGALTAIQRTDARGRFTIDHLPAAKFWIYAEPGNGDVVRVHGELAKGETRDVELGVPTGKVRLAGRVVTPGGEPIVGRPPCARGRIELVRAGTEVSEVHPADLGREGRFELFVAPGSYRVRVVPHTSERSVDCGTLYVEDDGDRDVILPGARVEVVAYVVGTGRTVDPDGDRGLVLRLSQPIEGDDRGRDRIHEAAAGADGRLVFDGVPPGRWTLEGGRLAEERPVVIDVPTDGTVSIDVLVDAR